MSEGLSPDGCPRSQDVGECVQKRVADADNEIKELYHPARHLLSSTPRLPCRDFFISNESVPTGLLNVTRKSKLLFPYRDGGGRGLMVKHCHTPRALGYK